MNQPTLVIGNVNWFKYASPQTFYPLAGAAIPWFGWAAAALCAAGLYVGFFVAPTDFQQGESYRIIFIHVPAALMSMFIYVVMAFWAGVGLAFNTRLSGMMASAIKIMPVNIVAAMVGARVRLTDAPWCRVFHHCTEK